MLLLADFETTAEYQALLENETKVYLWCIKDFNSEYSAFGVSIETFFDNILAIKEPTTIYFHNLSFDGEFILWYLLNNNYKLNYNGELMENEFTHLTTDNGAIYTISFVKNGVLYEFKCSYRLLPVSVKDLGKLVGVEKLDEEFDYTAFKKYNDISEVPKIDLEYIDHDVEIVKRALKVAFDNGINKLTIASSSYANWQKGNFMFAKSHLQKPDNEEVNQIINISYRGGITYLNPKKANKIFYKLKSFDVNSLYPSVMLAFSMPYGTPKILKESDRINNKKIHLYHIFITTAKIRKGFHPFIPYKKNKYGSYDFKDELFNFNCALWDEEFNLFQKYYVCDYVVLNILEFDCKYNLFDKYFNHWKNIKETTDNEVLRKIAKLMLNSLYGKFGTMDNKCCKHIIGKADTIKYEVVPSDTKYYYRAIASRITSCARTVFIKAMNENADRFIYGDTDSVYLENTDLPNLPLDDKKFGCWKDETVKIGGYYARAKFLKAKCYIKEHIDGTIKTSCAGLPKKAQSLITFDNLKDGTKFEKVKLQFCRFKGGVILKETDFTIKV